MTATTHPLSLTWLRRSLALALLLLAGVSQLASAHIDLQRAGTHVAKFEQGERGRDTKIGACGNPEGIATGAVYTYKPGETITIALAEYVRHPGYFRIAFDNDGDDDFVDPRWIVPVDPDNRAGGCPIDGTDQCRLGDQATEGDFFNNATVLMDNLNPHTRDTAQATYTWQVTLPNVECDNCTLQIIQVMEDPAGPAHGVYNTTTQDDDNDVYHQCIDLVLTPDAVAGDAANAAAKALMPAAP
ncbi:MAG: lytic polysaccharide monooxygenase [Pseudomonadales bacterium]|nr:lytic polysaccharide monooxygenase [Pseudomonadales bacterium]